MGVFLNAKCTIRIEQCTYHGNLDQTSTHFAFWHVLLDRMDISARAKSKSARNQPRSTTMASFSSPIPSSLSTHPKTCVVYHWPCNDGIAAALCASIVKPEATFVPLNTSENALNRLEEIPPACHLYLLDIVGGEDFLAAVLLRCQHVTIIDHHHTNIKVIQNAISRCNADDVAARLPLNLSIVMDMDHSGCMLAANHFQIMPSIAARFARDYFGTSNLMSLEMLLYAIEDSDLGNRFELPYTRKLIAGLIEENIDYNDAKSAFEKLLTLDLTAVMARGEASLAAFEKYIEHMLTKRIKVYPFIDSDVGFNARTPVYAIESPEDIGARTQGVLMALLKQAKEDDLIEVSLFARPCDVNPGMMKVSLRSKGDIDISALAKAHGGGGHKNAAACVISQTVWKLWTVC